MRQTVFLLILLLFISTSAHALEDIQSHRKEAAGLSIGDRIAFWAEHFVGTPYDPDPMGEYVTKKRIVTDGSADCMYHTFRSVELAMSDSDAGAVSVALRKRFHSEGKLGPGGEVTNYDDRYEYGMDMIRSGKWGADVTAVLGGSTEIEGARGVERVVIFSKEALLEGGGVRARGFRSGDIVYFIKDPEKRVVGEVVGHIGIIKVEPGGGAFLIHASGVKNRGGVVKKVPFSDYVSGMNFVGVKVTRFK